MIGDLSTGVTRVTEGIAEDQPVFGDKGHRAGGIRGLETSTQVRENRGALDPVRVLSTEAPTDFS